MGRFFPFDRKASAFSLIELMVVIAIIGLLAAMLLVALSHASREAKRKQSISEEVNLVGAITQYRSDYSRLPASSQAVAAAASANGNSGDFTFGTISNISGTSGPAIYNLPTVSTYGEATPAYQNFNSEVIAILRDDNFWPESNAGGQHIYNPKRTSLFNAKPAADTNSPGIGADDILRDPWGSPYIITLDLSYDGKCFDYTLNQLYQNNSPAPTSPLMVSGDAIVWSFGPDRTVQLTSPLNTGFNHQTITTSF
jgi:prepilin-type N-terminal cleavage/methylation domain-containing protein